MCTNVAQNEQNFACFYEGSENAFINNPFPGTGIEPEPWWRRRASS